MYARLIKIGNSQGICIPKAVIKQAGITDKVEIEVYGNTLVIRPAHPSRMGWNDAFHQRHQVGDEAMLDPGTAQASSWDHDEWEW